MSYERMLNGSIPSRLWHGPVPDGGVVAVAQPFMYTGMYFTNLDTITRGCWLIDNPVFNNELIFDLCSVAANATSWGNAIGRPPFQVGQCVILPVQATTTTQPKAAIYGYLL